MFSDLVSEFLPLSCSLATSYKVLKLSKVVRSSKLFWHYSRCVRQLCPCDTGSGIVSTHGVLAQVFYMTKLAYVKILSNYFDFIFVDW